MSRYRDLLKKRANEGDLPIAYDLYNRADVREILPTIPASYGIIGRIGSTLLFEIEDQCNFLKFLSSHGVVLAHENDCVSLTFGFCKTNLPHTPVMIGICKTITTMCDHDIGVIVDE